MAILCSALLLISYTKQMQTSIISRRLNPLRFLFPFTTHSLPSKPTSHFHSQTPKPYQNLSQKYDSNLVFETLSSYGNDWKRALDFFHWVETECQFQHTVMTYNRMIDILGKFFEFDVSWELIERMRKTNYAFPNHATFRVMFKRYVSAHLVSEAISTYCDRLEEFNLKDETSYCDLVDALCEYKHVVEAEEFCFGKNSGLNYSISINVTNKTKIYNMILRGWFKIGWWSKCRELWKEMDERGVCKDLHSYTIYMDILSKSRKPWKAVKLYKEMKSRGIKLDVVAYNTVIHGIGLYQGVDFAKLLHREMRELGCQPNVVTWNIVIKLLCENGRLKEAYAMFAEMHKMGTVQDAKTYHCFFACIEKPNELLSLFDRMIENGVQPKMDTYVMLMRKFGRWGFLRPVFVVWKKMEELGCSPDEFAYSALIDVLIQKGMFEMAKKYEEEMMEKGLSAKPRQELCTKVVEGC